MRNYPFLLGIILLAFILTGCLGAGSLPAGSHQQGALKGIVQDSDSGLALWSGQATLTGRNKTTYNAPIKNGVFEFNQIEPGIYTLRIETEFYQPMQKQVTITGATTTITEKLVPDFSSQELDLFARLVHSEAKGETYLGQVAVAASVLNRLNHRDYPNTLSGIVNQVVVANGRRYYQYEPVLNGSIHAPASQRAKDAVADALAGWDPSHNATGFFAPAKVGRGSWVWSRVPTTTIGGHRFFR